MSVKGIEVKNGTLVKVFDLTADGETQVELSGQIGGPGKYVFYIHQGGKTVVRLSGLTEKQIDITGVSTWKRDK